MALLVGVFVFGHAPRVLAADAEVSETSAKAKIAPSPSQKATADNGPFVIGLAPAFFWESTERSEKTVQGGGVFVERERADRVSAGAFNLQASFLAPFLSKYFRLGGGLGWFNSYTLQDPDVEDEESDDAKETYGHLFQLWVQPEFVIPEVVWRLNLLLGLRGGANILFAGKELRDDLDDLDRQGYDFMGGPRWGLFVGPHVGVLCPLAGRVSARLDFGVHFSKIWIYDAEAKSGGITTERARDLFTTRKQILLGLELAL